MSIVAALLVSAISLVGVFALSMKETLLRRTLTLLISLAAGALLGDAFIHLIPEAFEATGNAAFVSFLILAGILSFFLLEKFLRWHHSHGEDEFSPEHARIHPLGHLVLVSDGLHNLIDGLAIGAAFIISPQVGIATTVAIALHEIPQEIGDFGLLIHSGFTRAKALLMNFVSALFALIGVGLAFSLVELNASFLTYIAAFAAGNFVYIACADIVPELFRKPSVRASGIQVLGIALGLTAMFLLLGLG